MNFFLILFFLNLVNAQGNDMSRPDLNSLQQNGNLLSIRITPGRPIKLFVVGKEEAKVDLSQLKLTVRRLSPYPAEELAVQRTGEYYTLKSGPSTKRSQKLEVRTQLGEHLEEVFQFQLP